MSDGFCSKKCSNILYTPTPCHTTNPYLCSKDEELACQRSTGYDVPTAWLREQPTLLLLVKLQVTTTFRLNLQQGKKGSEGRMQFSAVTTRLVQLYSVSLSHIVSQCMPVCRSNYGLTRQGHASPNVRGSSPQTQQQRSPH